MEATFWSLVPAIVAIVLALITKEVYISLLTGILGGALFYTGFKLIPAIETIVTIMSDKVGGNINIIIFLVLLGMLVFLIQKSGASAAYGSWAAKRIRTKRGALGLTSLLGVLIFVDDYFNCLTVGTVMSPVTDKHKISRAKLAYIIDSTAAPVCIISPISSWAAAVSSSLPENTDLDGFSLFLSTIPFNLYALVTLIMVFLIIGLNFDFSRMKRYEINHWMAIHERAEGKMIDDDNHLEQPEDFKIEGKGKIIDLVLPIVSLIILCILAMLYTGGITEGNNIIDAFANCDSSFSLVLGSVFTLILTGVFYVARRVVKFTEFTSALAEGFKAMVPAILILTFAWTLSGVSGEGYLESGVYVSNAIQNSALSIGFIPAIFFLVALGLSFATGTSWGTFGILIPMIVPVMQGHSYHLLSISIAACLAGSVCGDHISPISDTTILSSAGARCNHIDHVSTQIPYALTVAIPCVFGYLVAGLTENGWLGLIVSIIGMMLIVFFNYRKQKNQGLLDNEQIARLAHQRKSE
ncbi:MAG: Na+/H+ antiporter NhaC family protein [Fastidiosipilaceae bacterium]|jgi:tetracycline resistance efflux pump|nr:Na+/H+ antiporter NhaC family protein [Clostridiaceae bacterium]